MATIRAYTDLEQSKKLAEILPLESADMEYLSIKENGLLVGNVPFVKDDSEVEDSAYSHTYDRIACWSLSALLGVLPNNKRITTTLSRGGWKIEPVEYIDKWFCEYEDEDSPSKNFSASADNPVDACYELIIKLNELKML